jgi:hypothetical protein
MATHQQSWVKVNTRVDCNMVRIVSALSSISGLETLQSCEGDDRGEAYVHFWYGPSWERACGIVFGGLLTALQVAGVPATAAVEIFNGSLPTARIAFDARALEQATLAVEKFTTESGLPRNSASVRDTEYREP